MFQYAPGPAVISKIEKMKNPTLVIIGPIISGRRTPWRSTYLPICVDMPAIEKIIGSMASIYFVSVAGVVSVFMGVTNLAKKGPNK